MGETTRLEEMDGARRLNASHPPFHRLTVIAARGTIDVVEAAGVMSIALNWETAPTTIGLMVYNPSPDPAGRGSGAMMQLSATQAREFASSLVHLANKLDPQGEN